MNDKTNLFKYIMYGLKEEECFEIIGLRGPVEYGTNKGNKYSYVYLKSDWSSFLGHRHYNDVTPKMVLLDIANDFEIFRVTQEPNEQWQVRNSRYRKLMTDKFGREYEKELDEYLANRMYYLKLSHAQKDGRDENTSGR